MGGGELAIEQFRAAAPQRRDQPGERHFRGIAGPAEHRFAAENPVEPDPVEPADQPISSVRGWLPAFKAMGMAEPVQLEIARHDSRTDPAFAAFAVVSGAARRGALFHHPGKGHIAGDAVAPAPQGARQRARAMKAAQRQDRAGVRLDPEHLGIIAAVGHGEDAAAIGQQQQVGRNRAGLMGAVHAGQCSKLRQRRQPCLPGPCALEPPAPTGV